MLSVEPWLVELRAVFELRLHHRCFSALSRAVVGGTFRWCGRRCQPIRFSALSRAVVGGTAFGVQGDVKMMWFQCSQSSRGWWNFLMMWFLYLSSIVSVLSVEPWLVEPVPELSNRMPQTGFQCSQSSRGWWNYDASIGDMEIPKFQCSQSSRGWWNWATSTSAN